MLGPWEIAAIMLAILLVFGAKRIPEIARGLGKGIREFKDATNDIKQELNVTDTKPRQVAQQTHYVAPQQAVPPPAQQAAPVPPVAPPAEGQAPSA